MPTCKEEELGCSDRPRAASDHHYSSHLSIQGRRVSQYLLFVKKMHFLVFATQKAKSMSDEECDFEYQQVCGFIRLFVDDNI
ncbi:hypothetical protein CR513_09433, partial [Mucuna pruriens]